MTYDIGPNRSDIARRYEWVQDTVRRVSEAAIIGQVAQEFSAVEIDCLARMNLLPDGVVRQFQRVGLLPEAVPE